MHKVYKDSAREDKREDDKRENEKRGNEKYRFIKGVF
jgi:hypothetical protein